MDKSTDTTKKGLAQMLKGGVIMDVVTAEHARIAEEAGAVAVMALERVPADIRVEGGVARTEKHPLFFFIREEFSYKNFIVVTSSVFFFLFFSLLFISS